MSNKAREDWESLASNIFLGMPTNIERLSCGTRAAIYYAANRIEELQKRVDELEDKLVEQSEFEECASVGLSDYTRLAEHSDLVTALKAFVDDDRHEVNIEGIGLAHPGEPLLMLALQDAKSREELEAENEKLRQGQWVKQSNRLPKNNTYVLCSLIDETEPNGCRLALCVFYISPMDGAPIFSEFQTGEHWAESVTHWMPIEPPRD